MFIEDFTGRSAGPKNGLTALSFARYTNSPDMTLNDVVLANVTVCESGGIGRRAGFRFQCPLGRGGSTPPFRTSEWGGEVISPPIFFLGIGSCPNHRQDSVEA